MAKPTKHFGLITWRLLYRLDVAKTVDRVDEVEACERGKLPLTEWDRQKAEFPKLWQRLLEKRQRRLEYFQKHGSVPDGWTPPDPNDGRTANRPVAAYLARRRLLAERASSLRRRKKRGPSPVVKERVARWLNQGQ